MRKSLKAVKTKFTKKHSFVFWHFIFPFLIAGSKKADNMKFLKKFNMNWCHQSDNSLIENGEDLNSDESEGCWTPIQCAIFEGNVNILRKLIAKGVNVNLMFAEDRFTPLTFAIDLNKVKIVRFLIENALYTRFFQK